MKKFTILCLMILFVSTVSCDYFSDPKNKDAQKEKSANVTQEKAQESDTANVTQEKAQESDTGEGK